MSDIALVWDGESADLGIATGGASSAPNDLLGDDGLETSVTLSLFLDRRAEDGDVLPPGETDRRGWWGDSFPVTEGDRVGSRLWLLAREKQTPALLARAEQIVREALQWMLDDKITNRIDVTVEFVAQGVMGFDVSIFRPHTDQANYRFTYAWAAQEAKRA